MDLDDSEDFWGRSCSGVKVVEALLRRPWTPLALLIALLVVAALELELDLSSRFAFQGREPVEVIWTLLPHKVLLDNIRHVLCSHDISMVVDLTL